MKKILFVITLLLMGISNVNAEPCDAYDIKRLKEIAEGVEITYELQEPYENDEGMTVYNNYIIKINGLSEELYIYDEINEIRYKKSDAVNGKIEYKSNNAGKISFVIYSSYCPNKIKSLSIKLPIYNFYRQREECKEIDYKIKYCDEYLSEDITDVQFYKVYNEYKESVANRNDNNQTFIKYLIIGLTFIIFISAVVFLLNKRKGRLE